jgi:hypothetical protein
MKIFLFWISLFCTTMICIFLWTKLSLNGYKSDFYFFAGTLLLNVICFWKLYKAGNTRRISFINLTFAGLQIIGLCIFLWLDTLQVDQVFEPQNTKYNLYASLNGWYKRAYFKPHQADPCNDGELWETKVPYYFPLIEIEITRDECHKVNNDSNYRRLFIHVPE